MARAHFLYMIFIQLISCLWLAPHIGSTFSDYNHILAHMHHLLVKGKSTYFSFQPLHCRPIVFPNYSIFVQAHNPCHCRFRNLIIGWGYLRWVNLVPVVTRHHGGPSHSIGGHPWEPIGNRISCHFRLQPFSFPLLVRDCIWHWLISPRKGFLKHYEAHKWIRRDDKIQRYVNFL